MATFLLIHGVWGGAWCWREVVPLLEASGHCAIAIDLPGHGDDPTPPEEVTLQDYLNCIKSTVEALNEPPILVGHSMGGVLIGDVAEDMPNRVRALVAIASVFPEDGKAMIEAVGATHPEYQKHFIWSPDRRAAILSPQGVREYFYNRCSPEIIEEAITRMRPEPVAPYMVPIRSRADRSRDVPRFYIGGKQDKIVTPEMQLHAVATLASGNVLALDSDHAPYFSAPDELSEVLAAFANA